MRRRGGKSSREFVGGEKERIKRVGSGVRVLRWGCGMEWSLERREGVGVGEKLWGVSV